MARRKINMGVVGLGRIGFNFHCKNMAAHRQVRLAAVCDPSEDRLQEVKTQFGAQGYRDLNAFLKHADLDAVVVASPTHFHKVQAIACLKAKKHVILEKPMALNVTEAKAITKAAKAHKRLLTIYQPHRLMCTFHQIKKVIDSGLIGDLLHVKKGWFNLVRRNDWQALKKYGGGMLNNYGAHSLDFLLALTGRDVADVHATFFRVAAVGDCEDVFKVVYRTKKGVIGESDVNMACPIKPYEVEVYGTRGTLVLEKGELIVHHVVGKVPKVKSIPNWQAKDDATPIRRLTKEKRIKVSARYDVDLYADFAKAILNRGKPLVRPETLSVMQLMETCRKKAGKIYVKPMK